MRKQPLRLVRYREHHTGGNRGHVEGGVGMLGIR